MAFNVLIDAVYTPALPETRDAVFLTVNYDDVIYKWQRYIPKGYEPSSYIESIIFKIKDEIDYKESLWQASLKTKSIVDPETGNTITVDIDKSEIVAPDIPDYYAQRRDIYPAVGDQLDALAKGINSSEYADILAKIQQVKQEHPKPPYA